MEGQGMESLNAQQLAQIQATSGAGSSGQNPDAKKQESEMRDEMLSQILTSEARERLGRINLVKPEKAKQIGDLLLSMAARGQIAKKVTQDELVDILERINSSTQKETKIVYSRRNIDDSDDEDEYDL
ncbi:Programmed cell death protein 5 [Smittium culicis]|uniref:Programmed cell death protein 5 n=1 Tax=Smittium culicis TaxID=133412 RepID=A0A1R1YK36_9FUNG|nr:Programmed cell death protein 5 [Smittium culicis]